jgi:hypothetical protein
LLEWIHEVVLRAMGQGKVVVVTDGLLREKPARLPPITGAPAFNACGVQRLRRSTPAAIEFASNGVAESREGDGPWHMDELCAGLNPIHIVAAAVNGTVFPV